MATQELSLKAALAQARAMTTLARYKAREGLKQRYRSAGIKITGVPYRDLCLQADQYLAENREEIMAWAQRAVAQSKTSRPKAKR